MQFKNLVAFLAAATAVQAMAEPEPEPEFEFEVDMVERASDFSFEEVDIAERDLTLVERANGCVKGVHMVVAGGEGSVKGDIGYLQSLVNKIKAKVPHSNYHQCPYPPNADAGSSIAIGTREMRKHVHEYRKKCPKSKMALIGYSAGGAVVMDTLCGDVEDGAHSLATSFNKHIVANIVYGDPTFVAGLKYDRGTCDGSQGGSDVPRAKPGRCAPFGKKTRSYCDYNDPECCNGSDPNVHFEYPSLYDDKASNFVRDRRRRARHNKHN